MENVWSNHTWKNAWILSVSILLGPTWLQPGDKNLDLIIIGNQLIFPKFFFKPFKKFPLATTRSQYCFSKLFWHKLKNSIAKKELGQKWTSRGKANSCPKDMPHYHLKGCLIAPPDFACAHHAHKLHVVGGHHTLSNLSQEPIFLLMMFLHGIWSFKPTLVMKALPNHFLGA